MIKLTKENPSYSVWASMIQRCTNKKRDSWNIYGGRGITVCQEWMESFEAFDKDMGPRPIGTSIDRKDPNGNYYKENCRWATPSEQAETKRKPICKKCKNCKESTKTGGRWRSWNGLCHSCNEYLRRNKESRPLNAQEIIAKKNNRVREAIRKPVIGINILDGTIQHWDAVTDAVKEYGMGVVNCLSFKSKTCKGFKWYYSNEPMPYKHSQQP